MPIKGVMLILFVAVILAVFYKGKICDWLTQYFNEENNEENKED